MITQCPSCRTHFRVRIEQLSARAGQVRCGKCSRIFDALEYLVEDLAAAGKPTTPAQEAPIAAAAVPEAAPAEPATLAADARSAQVQQPLTASSAEAESPPIQAEPAMSGTDADLPTQADTVEAAPESGASAYEFGPDAAADPAKARRWPWLLGAVLLLFGLLAQAAYYYRSTLIVLFPEAKPYATRLCAALRCDLPLPQRIEQMSIEASDLQADTTNPNVMVLSATLKNRAIFAQQLPLLELTLTNAQDQPVVRRVLTPQDYIGKAADVQAGFAANSETVIKVFIEGSQVKATGYRLYLFYP